MHFFYGHYSQELSATYSSLAAQALLSSLEASLALSLPLISSTAG
jgi:hypothetical protein